MDFDIFLYSWSKQSLTNHARLHIQNLQYPAQVIIMIKTKIVRPTTRLTVYNVHCLSKPLNVYLWNFEDVCMIPTLIPRHHVPAKSTRTY